MEHTYLMDLVRARGKQRSRILYVFRTVPGLKLGREAFDPDTRRIIEHANPGVEFDWDALIKSIPPPEPEVDVRRFQRRPKRVVRPSEAPREPEAAEEPAPGPFRGRPRPAAAPAALAGPVLEAEGERPGADAGTQAEAEEVERGPRFPTEIEGATVRSRLAWLRVSHAETVARIEQEIRDEPRRSELLAAAARLNPAGWESPVAIEAGLADAAQALIELARAFNPPPRPRRPRRIGVDSDPGGEGTQGSGTDSGGEPAS